jgi:two-component system heavy metal sensor histidine kinase CusS
MFPLTFRLKLALWAALLCGVVLLAFVAASSLIVYDNMLEEADFQLKQNANRLVERIREKKGTPEQLQDKMRRATISAEPAELSVIRLLQNGDLLLADPEWLTPPGIQSNAPGRLKTVRHDGESWRVMARHWEEDGFEILIAIELSEITDEVIRMAKTYLAALPVALLIIGIGAWWIARQSVRPIRLMTGTAERVTAGHLSERIAEHQGRDEIARLTRVFNRMMDKLERSFQQTSRFSSDASHELRTPLAVLQGKIEEALGRPEASNEQQALLADLLEQTQRLKSIIQGLLLLSRADTGRLSIERETIDIGELVASIGEDVEFLIDGTGIRYESELPRGLFVRGDPKLLRIAAFNLFQNAVRYNSGGGAGYIRCSLKTEANAVNIDVANTGEEIPESDRNQIFERFFRSAEHRSVQGQGLGLSLSRVIMEAHGGTLELLSTEDGLNTFRLRLPR